MGKWSIVADEEINETIQSRYVVIADTEEAAIDKVLGGEGVVTSTPLTLKRSTKFVNIGKWSSTLITVARHIIFHDGYYIVKDNNDIIARIIDDGNVDDIVNGFDLRLRDVGDIFKMKFTADMKADTESFITSGKFTWTLNEAGDLVRSDA